MKPSNLDRAPPLKKQWSLFCSSWINQRRFSGNSGSKLHKLCVAPSLIWINLFSELCVWNLDHHTGLFCKYCRKCRIQILCGIQYQNKWSVDSSLTQNMSPKNRRNLSWFWKLFLGIPDKLFPLSASRNQVNGVDYHQKAVFFTTDTIGQKNRFRTEKAEYVTKTSLHSSHLQWYPILYRCWNNSAMEINRISIPSKKKKGIVTKTQMAFSDGAWMYHLFPLHYKLM